MRNQLQTSTKSSNERLAHVLNHIKSHLQSPLGLEDLADISGWSRWQLQRVFNNTTGLTLAQYVRQLRLSAAANSLLTTPQKQIDIALSCGFDSEISFSRSFKQVFGCTPGAYRKRGALIGVRFPIQPECPNPIRIETMNGFTLRGIHCEIDHALSEQKDFLKKVPKLWQNLDLEFERKEFSRTEGEGLGVIDVVNATGSDNKLRYWAGVKDRGQPLPNKLESVEVPDRAYVVITHRGPVQTLAQSVKWVVCDWLPQSGLKALSAFDLEVYHRDTDSELCVEYWIPVEQN